MHGRLSNFAGIESEKQCTDTESMKTAHVWILEYIKHCGQSYHEEYQDIHMSLLLGDIL